MKLYHGTTESHLESILANGLVPRYRKPGNWSKGLASMKGCVYLSDALAPYFAAWCQPEKLDRDRGLVVEIDVDRLDPSFLLPDEDYIRLVLSQQREPLPVKPSDWLITMMDNSDRWKASLEYIGTCAHLGVIARRAITRVALFNRDPIHLSRFDNSVSPIAYALMAQSHRESIAFMFGGPPPTQRDNAIFLNKEIIMEDDPRFAEVIAERTEFLITHRNANVEVIDFGNSIKRDADADFRREGASASP